MPASASSRAPAFSARQMQGRAVPALPSARTIHPLPPQCGQGPALTSLDGILEIVACAGHKKSPERTGLSRRDCATTASVTACEWAALELDQGVLGVEVAPLLG